MQFRLRTLFLTTTVVAIIAFTFTLGIVEGVFTLMFFAAIFGSSKKDQLISSIIFVILLVGVGVFSKNSLRTDLGRLNNGETACVSIFFTGKDQKRQKDVYGLLVSEMSSGKAGVICSSRGSGVPFFRAGCIEVRFDKEQLADIEAEVRQRIGEKFPNLTVSIEGHSALGTKGRPRP